MAKLTKHSHQIMIFTQTTIIQQEKPNFYQFYTLINYFW